MNKKGSIHRYTIQDSRAIEGLGDFASLALNWDDLDRAIDAVREWTENQSDSETLEFFLEKFEAAANQYLWGSPRRPSPDLEQFHEEAAKQVLLSCSLVRARLEAGRPHAAVLEMMKLLSAGMTVQLHDPAMTGIRAKAGQKTGGRKTKTKRGIEAALKLIRPKTSGARGAWTCFMTNHGSEETALEVGAYKVFFYDEILWQIGPDGEEQSISFETFRKHYPYNDSCDEAMRFFLCDRYDAWFRLRISSANCSVAARS